MSSVSSAPVKVSVVLPSLNVAEYVTQTIDSVLKQSLPEIEIICVDAMSDDGTRQILEAKAKKDTRVKLVTTETRSYGHQVNLGIAKATGEYVAVVDTDDYVLPRMYQELYEWAEKYDADVVKSDFYRFVSVEVERKDHARSDRENQSTKTVIEEQRTYEPLFKTPEFYDRPIRPLDEPRVFMSPNNTWNGIYRRQFLLDNAIEHNESAGASFQDNGFWFQTMVYAQTVVFMDRAFYMCRRDNQGSSVYKTCPIDMIPNEFRFIEDKLEGLPADDWEQLKPYFHYKKYSAYMAVMNRTPLEQRRQYVLSMSEEFSEYRDSKELDPDIFGAVPYGMVIRIIDRPDNQWRSDLPKHANG